MVSARMLVRKAVAIAALAPAIALLVLAFVLFRSGGFGGFLGGLVVVAIAMALFGVAFMASQAPVSIHWMLQRTERERADRAAGRPLEAEDHEGSSNGSSGTNSH